MVSNTRRRILLVIGLALLLTAALSLPMQAAMFQVSPPPPPPGPPPSVPPTPLPVITPRPPVRPPISPSTCSGFRYQVRFGDTLNRIAARFGTTVSAIVRCNGLANPNRIFAGQKLLIPAKAPAYTPSCSTVYFVRWGDTLARIAARFNVTISAIMAVNHISNPNWIWAGQRLVIPCDP